MQVVFLKIMLLKQISIYLSTFHDIQQIHMYFYFSTCNFHVIKHNTYIHNKHNTYT
ncbi:unnamed protein product [Arabidopsis halleri]